ncbi:MAG: molybdopterin-dependent oxidoreductase, partial [Chloroflexi bacterium]|nr:molybdopterin-dependent oxidoreductase [Chloroflexota bacterium]
ALMPGAPLVHPDAASYGLTVDPAGAPGAALAPGPNISSSHMQRFGDLERGFVQADRIFEHTFTIPAVHQGYLEPHACLVRAEATGQMDVWLTNKSPFFTREDLSQATGVPERQVRVHLAPLGGEFGGKGSLMDAAVAYHLARATGRPVKMVMTYAEELSSSNPRHDALVTLRTGVSSDGR